MEYKTLPGSMKNTKHSEHCLYYLSEDPVLKVALCLTDVLEVFEPIGPR